jgi:aerobic carbon-monoxide dehydrogenase large subunit
VSAGGSTAKLLGARVRRLEDPRVLLGKTRYVDDVRLPGLLAMAFVRSPYAHARIRSIDLQAARHAADVIAVLAAADIEAFLPPLRYDHDPATGRAPCRSVVWPVLASGKVRFVGEAVAVVVAQSRAAAEDAAALVEVEWDPLEPVVDLERASEPGTPLVHEEWPDNVFQRVAVSLGDVAGAFRGAHVVVSERFRTGRHMALPIEGRGVVAAWEEASETLTVWASTQMPHVLRAEIARIVGLGEHTVRVIARDVGGGFGLKAHVFPEELLVPVLARRLRRPVEWIEDRREHLAASQHAKDQIVRAELALAKDGTMLGLRAHVTCDIGAYTEYPWPTFEANVTAMAMPGPYKIAAYAYETLSVATNKCSIGAYRGVGQPIGVLALERLIDVGAARLGLDRVEVRRRNMIAGPEHPYTTVHGTQIESGSHRQCLEKAVEMIDVRGFEARRREARARGRRRGIGIASYVEVTAPSSQVWQMLGPATGGFEPATLRMETDGRVTVAIGVNSQGQSHETTFAQIAADRLGVPLADVRVVQGDTATTPRGWVTGGSKSAVATGGAVLRAAAKVRAKLLLAASRLTEIPAADLDLQGGAVCRAVDGAAVVPIRDIARAVWLSRAGLPSDEEPGLEVTTHYEPPPLTHSNATHAVEVEVDVETGEVRIVRYVVAEDCGTILNPMVVDGQIQGGVAQGIGSALYEEVVYDENGQLLTGTLMDYLPPTAADVPRIEIVHFETPSPHTEGGMKGVGEGGAIAPPAAIANAVADALGEFSPRVNRIPLTPERVLALIEPRR